VSGRFELTSLADLITQKAQTMPVWCWFFHGI
jgi:hypothetical protein